MNTFIYAWKAALPNGDGFIEKDQVLVVHAASKEDAGRLVEIKGFNVTDFEMVAVLDNLYPVWSLLPPMD